MPPPVVDAILVTYGRSESLIEVCRSALRQTIPLRTLVLVDNNDAPVAAEIVARLDASTEITVIHPGANLGPAGGIAAGFEHLQDEIGGLEWVLMLDDDDPLPADDIVERLLGAIGRAPGRVGGVGLMGARFEQRLLLTRPVDLTEGGLVRADSLHGWAAPLYRAAALEDAGGFRPELFWGLEELDTGLRLRRSGWPLYVAADVLAALPPPDKLTQRPGRPRLGLDGPSPRDYYRLRNTVDIGRRYFGAWNVIAAVTVRAVLKPLASLPLRPRVAIRTLRQNRRAVRDAFRRRLGRTIGLDA